MLTEPARRPPTEGAFLTKEKAGRASQVAGRPLEPGDLHFVVLMYLPTGASVYPGFFNASRCETIEGQKEQAKVRL